MRDLAGRPVPGAERVRERARRVIKLVACARKAVALQPLPELGEKALHRLLPPLPSMALLTVALPR
eukprot:6940403-Prymnesium_polylepis.1